MSGPRRTRSKRPLSPSSHNDNPVGPRAAVLPDTRARKNPRMSPSDLSRFGTTLDVSLIVVHDPIQNLTSQQKDDLLRRLVESDSAKRTMTALLPSIIPSQPELVQNTQSRYFDNRVDWCEAMLGDRAWSRHSAIPKTDICKMTATAVESELAQLVIAMSHNIDGSPNITPNKCSIEEYYVDAATALLDIGLMMFKRKERFQKDDEHPTACACLCIPCLEPHIDPETDDTACPVHKCFDTLRRAMIAVQPNMEVKNLEDYGRDDDGESEDSEREVDDEIRGHWIYATFYAFPDGTPQDLRLAILKYLDLPPLLPYPGPDHEFDNHVEESLRNCIHGINEIIKSGKMPKPTGRPLPQIYPDFIELDDNGRPVQANN